MTELEELTHENSFIELADELNYQLKVNHESIGGSICSHLLDTIKAKLKKENLILISTMGHVFKAYQFKSRNNANAFIESNQNYVLLAFYKNTFLVASIEPVINTQYLPVEEIKKSVIGCFKN